MRLVLVGEQIELADVVPATLASDQVRIDVAYAGICGSDLHRLGDPAGSPAAADLGYDTIPSGQDDPAGDTSFGHEYSGIVREVGDAVRSLTVGDRVIGVPRAPCTRCRRCRAGLPMHCERFAFPARGAWADEIVVPERFVYRVPDDVSLRDAAVCEPLACAMRGVDRAAAAPGHAALVIGGGPIGLLAAALALRCGARTVVLSEPQAARREIAAALGAIAIAPRAQPLPELAAIHGDGVGFDVVYEAVGRPQTIADAIGLASPGGTVVVLGVPPTNADVPIDAWRLFERELTVTAAFGPELCFQRSLELLPKLNLDPLVSHVLDLEEVERAIEIAASGDCGKVLLAPAGTDVD